MQRGVTCVLLLFCVREPESRVLLDVADVVCVFGGLFVGTYMEDLCVFWDSL